MPDTIISLSINDSPTNNSWTFARPSHRSENDNYWLMPHFGFWSWPVQYVGSLDEALYKIEKIERAASWNSKIAKAAWRGTQQFNPTANPNLRFNLLQVSKGKEWADIQASQTGDGAVEDSNIIPIEDFCRYRYIIYTEVRDSCKRFEDALLILSNLGRDILRSSLLPPSLRLHHTDSSATLPSTHNSSPTAALFDCDTLHF